VEAKAWEAVWRGWRPCNGAQGSRVHPTVPVTLRRVAGCPQPKQGGRALLQPLSAEPEQERGGKE